MAVIIVIMTILFGMMVCTTIMRIIVIAIVSLKTMIKLCSWRAEHVQGKPCLSRTGMMWKMRVAFDTQVASHGTYAWPSVSSLLGQEELLCLYFSLLLCTQCF